MRTPLMGGARSVALTLSFALRGSAPARGQQEVPERELETFETPDGLHRIEREVRRSGDTAVNDGSWRRFGLQSDADASDAEPVAEGRWSDGLLEGEWVWRYPDGSPKRTGSFAQGRRVGAWEFRHPGGTSAGSGSYSLGLRNGRWDDRLADGTRDERYAGTYNLSERTYWPGRERRLLVETRRARHGIVSGWWRSGAPMLVGRYYEGRPEGAWSLWLVDGTLDPELVTGWYAGGERVDAEPRAHARDAFDWSFEERFQLEAELAGRAAGLPPPTRHGKGITTLQREALQEQLRRFLAGDAAQFEPLRDAGRPLISDLLHALCGLDLEDPAAVEQGEQLCLLLRAICGGRGFEWRSATDGGAPAANRLAQARWLSWWELVREDDAWWEGLSRGEHAGEGELLTLALLTGEAGLPPPARSATGALDPAASLSFYRPRNEGRAKSDALERALNWLLAHQNEDGSWSSAGFPARCGAGETKPCTMPGHSAHDVGVTGLALLALMANGRTAGLAAAEEPIRRGLAWLVDQQRSERSIPGLIGERIGKEFLYGHAIAAKALAEGQRFSEGTELVDPLRLAALTILAARNADAAWRYDLPPSGESDTSVTGWMVAALTSAAEAGVPFDPGAREGALAWIDKATDYSTGRIGYDSEGSASARIPNVNDQYPIDQTECMTAVGLLSRLLLGQDPGRESVLNQHAELMLRALPTWSPTGRTNDMYYWYHGTEALHRLHSVQAKLPYWSAWSTAVSEALLGSQCTEGHSRGSWDPDGPWGVVGGRVYATALAALILERQLPPPRRPPAAR